MLSPPLFFFFQAEDGIRDVAVTGVQTCALPIAARSRAKPLNASARLRARLPSSAAAIATPWPPGDGWLWRAPGCGAGRTASTAASWSDTGSDRAKDESPGANSLASFLRQCYR